MAFIHFVLSFFKYKSPYHNGLRQYGLCMQFYYSCFSGSIYVFPRFIAMNTVLPLIGIPNSILHCLANVYYNYLCSHHSVISWKLWPIFQSLKSGNSIKKIA